MRPWRMGTALLSLFGALALGVAGVGLYAVFAHAIAERRREMAIRIAIGAQPGRVLAMILREAGRLAAAGVLQRVRARRGRGPMAGVDARRHGAVGSGRARCGRGRDAVCRRPGDVPAGAHGVPCRSDGVAASGVTEGTEVTEFDTKTRRRTETHEDGRAARTRDRRRYRSLVDTLRQPPCVSIQLRVSSVTLLCVLVRGDVGRRHMIRSVA